MERKSKEMLSLFALLNAGTCNDPTKGLFTWARASSGHEILSSAAKDLNLR